VHSRVTTRMSTVRLCARVGCNAPVKKPTNRYCSVACCAMDPDRLERLRAQAQRARHVVLPMTHQLSLGLWKGQLGNPEAEIDILGEGREDVPRGMSHLAG
jgi:hypothetical protein